MKKNLKFNLFKKEYVQFEFAINPPIFGVIKNSARGLCFD